MSFFDIIIWPFVQLLLLFNSITGNYGVALMLFAVVVRLVMLPFQMKSKRSMLRMSRLNPRIKELEKKHGANKQKYQEEVTRLYKEEKVNPMSGCLWGLLPFPIIIMLFTIIREPLAKLMYMSAERIAEITSYFSEMGHVFAEKTAYPQLELAHLIHENFSSVRTIFPEVVDINFSFLGMNLGQTPDWLFFTHTDMSSPAIWLPLFGLFLLPVLSALAAMLQTKIAQKTQPQQSEQGGASMKMMLYMAPVMSLVFGYQIPGALSVYWATGSLLSILQDLWLNRRYGKILDAEDAERNAQIQLREEELERKRLETERLRLEGATAVNKSTSRRKRHVQEKVREEERQAAIIAAERGKPTEEPPSQVGSRKYARGRAYVEERYSGSGEGENEELTHEDGEHPEALLAAHENFEDTPDELEESVNSGDEPEDN